MTIQSFLYDECFTSKTLRRKSTTAQNVGELDRVLMEHFSVPESLYDLRSERMTLTFGIESYLPLDPSIYLDDAIYKLLPEAEAQLILDELDTSQTTEYQDLADSSNSSEDLPTGPVSLTNSSSHLVYDSSKLSTDESTFLDNLPDEQYNYLFNIIEYLTVGTLSTDELSVVNNFLKENTDDFSGYVDGSVSKSALGTVATLYGIDDAISSIHRFVPKWAEFDYVYNGSSITIRVWYDKEYFKVNYPYYDVVTIIPPFTLEQLLNPSSIESGVNGIISNRDYLDDIITPTINNGDQTGSIDFPTRYDFNDVSYVVPFNIIYRGRQPNDVEIRNLLANYLLDSGLATEEIWKIRFPDLFVSNSFFLIPYYDTVITTITGKSYPSFVDPVKLVARLATVQNLLTSSSSDYKTLLSISYNKMFVGMLNGDSNNVDTFEEIHPYYRDYSSQDTSFSEMPSATRDFCLLLNQGIAVAMGEINDLEYTTINVDGMDFVAFVDNKTIYYILTLAEHNKRYL